MASLVRFIEEHGARRSDQLACRVDDRSLTYGEFADGVLRVATALRELGLRPGDRVSLFLPNSVDYVLCFYGAMRAGLIANPINPAFTAPEVRYMIGDAGAAAVIGSPELLARIGAELMAPQTALVISTGADPPAPWHPLSELLGIDPKPLELPTDDAPACLPYSSGTTGRTKGIVHTHASLSMQALQSANHLQFRPHDVLVQSLPLVHLYPGNIIMGGLFVAGASMVVQGHFDPPAFVTLIEEVQATCCAGVPTTYALLNQVPEDTIRAHRSPRLEIAFSAGAILQNRLRQDFHRHFGVEVLDCYGITEGAGNLVANLRYGPHPEFSCGVPYPLTDIRLVDPHDEEVPTGEVGELTARGPQIMKEYWHRPDATEVTLRGGWLHTGDLARRDEAGYYYIVDRKNDMIIAGGYNVYPAEVEEVLQAHPDVAMCAVFGVPDDIKGEKPWAAVVLRQSAGATPENLDAHCRASLAAYKVPRQFLIVDDLPRSSVGKILRRELRDRYTPAPAETKPAGDAR